MKKWPKMTANTVRWALYLRNHTPYDLNSWHTGGIISPEFFLFCFVFLQFFQMLIFGVKSGVKGQKMAQNDQKLYLVTLHISGSIHYMIMIFGTPM